MHEPRWHGEFRKCSDLFTISKTDDGFCCSFNTISLAEGFAECLAEGLAKGLAKGLQEGSKDPLQIAHVSEYVSE